MAEHFILCDHGLPLGCGCFGCARDSRHRIQRLNAAENWAEGYIARMDDEKFNRSEPTPNPYQENAEDKGAPAPIAAPEKRCILCGSPKEAHYDGSQCPIGPDTWSATQTFEAVAPTEFEPNETNSLCDNCNTRQNFYKAEGRLYCEGCNFVAPIAAAETAEKDKPHRFWTRSDHHEATCHYYGCDRGAGHPIHSVAPIAAPLRAAASIAVSGMERMEPIHSHALTVIRRGCLNLMWPQSQANRRNPMSDKFKPDAQGVCELHHGTHTVRPDCSGWKAMYFDFPNPTPEHGTKKPCPDCLVLPDGTWRCDMNCGPCVPVEPDPLGILAAQRIARGHAKLSRELATLKKQHDAESDHLILGMKRALNACENCDGDLDFAIFIIKKDIAELEAQND